jgi:hypothetical protein
MIRYVILSLSLVTATWCLADDDGDENEHGAGRRRETRSSLASASNALWKAECGSCHLAFQPGLLPERSWTKMMAGLDDHFGENASLEPDERDAIAKFLSDNAADRSAARRSQKIARSIPERETPLRLTETTWFARKHDDIGAKVWKRQAVGSPANCAACHRGAEAGNFSEDDVRVPR